MLIQVNLFASGSASGSVEALEIMKKVNSLNKGNTTISDITMILIDRRKNKRVRHIKKYQKNFGNHTRSILFFASPADVKNTSLLTKDWAGARENNFYLYLPALRHPKRITPDIFSRSFMGSDYSYSDMSSMKTDDWKFKIKKKSEKIDGHDTWVIEARPKNKRKKKVIKETGYLKQIFWVRKDIHMVVKAKMWVKKGKKIKYYSATDIKRIQGIWTVGKVTMVTKKRKRTEHATVILMNKTVYNRNIHDSMFTVQRMQRGL